MIVIALDFKAETYYYVKTNQDGSWCETYNPVNATQFKSREDAHAWIVDNTNFTEYSIYLRYEHAKNIFDAWVAGGMIRCVRPAVNRKHSYKYDPAKHDKYTVLQWKLDTCNTEVTYDVYKTWPDLFSLFKHLFDMAFYGCGKNERKLTFNICVRKDSNFNDFKEELDLIIDKVQYCDEDGNKMLPIFDYLLSQNGTAFLVKNGDDTWSVTTDWHDEIANKSLEECFDYMVKHRYYE